MDPTYSSEQFYRHLLAVPNWQNMSITVAAQTVQRSGFHKGLDIGAPIGTPILAANTGTVISSGPASGYGLWVRIQRRRDRNDLRAQRPQPRPRRTNRPRRPAHRRSRQPRSLHRSAPSPPDRDQRPSHRPRGVLPAARGPTLRIVSRSQCRLTSWSAAPGTASATSRHVPTDDHGLSLPPSPVAPANKAAIIKAMNGFAALGERESVPVNRSMASMPSRLGGTSDGVPREPCCPVAASRMRHRCVIAVIGKNPFPASVIACVDRSDS